MLRLHVIQAEQGDCLLLEWGEAKKPTFLLVDGGPVSTYKNHLKGVLKRRLGAGRIERVLLSHVDDDHVHGLLDFFSDLRNGGSKIQVGGLWHNTFTEIVGPKVVDGFVSLVGRGFPPGDTTYLVTRDRDIRQGDTLTHLAADLSIPINQELGQQSVFCLDDLPKPMVINGLTLRVLGPRRKNLERLRVAWEKFLAQQNKNLDLGITPRDSDASVPNLSSIVFLVEAQGKRILLTGDGRSDHLLQGLRKTGLLKPGKTFHVDVLKLPHHGSARNASPEFFKLVTADTYIISANGMYNNPDLETLEWIAQAAREQGRKVDILLTNQTGKANRSGVDALKQKLDVFLAKYPADDYGYHWICMPEDGHAMTLDLFPAVGAPAVVFDRPKKASPKKKTPQVEPAS